LFIVCCGSLSVISGVCFIFLPESPKFVFSKGNSTKALEILKRVYKINTGLDDKNYNVKEISADDEDQNESFEEPHGNFIVSLLKSMWRQTAPLFQKSHLKNTFNLCTIQFLIFITSNG
jgi:MFS transporter, VNT family, synaptic vesicle glycoprotein 2